MTQNDGGPAFPLQIENEDHVRYSQFGMSLRDWFAGQALNGVTHWNDSADKAAMRCYEIADAMLKERKIKP